MRLAILSTLALILLGCERNSDLLKGLPIVSDATFKVLHNVDGVPVAEYGANSAKLMDVVRSYDAILSKKWNRITV